MRKRGLGRLRLAARRLRNIFIHKGLILLYHRVSELATDPQLLSVTPEHFGEHLEILRKYYRFISLQQLALTLKEGNFSNRGVVVTFDDGYADNLYNAKPLLERYGIPAMVSVTTGYVGQAKEFWWDELERLLLLSPRVPKQLKVTVHEETIYWRMDEGATSVEGQWHVALQDTPTSRHRAYRDLHRLLRPLRYKEQEEVLADLREQMGDNGQCRTDYQALTPEEVRRLAADGLVEIGSHTVTHPVLSVQPLEVQRRELVESKGQLEAILGHPVTSLAYSYGGGRDAGDETAALARAAGYEIGCANFPALVTHRSDIFKLPRYLVRDWNGDEFAWRLERWFRG
jgi:peptidoglycan/xylan/chitin deacetylase (PgdA/CDA1 family)